MKALLFDIDGVLYQQGNAIAGAPEALQWVQQQHIPYRFLTNTTSKPLSRIIADLQQAGINADQQHVLTPPLAARQWLRQQNISAAELLVPDGIRSEFSELDNSGTPQAVVVGDMGYGFRFDDLNHAFRTLMSSPDVPLIALGMTRYFAAADGLQLDAGPFVKALEYATGKQAVVMGKPAAAFFQLALAAMGAAPADTLMLGDDRVGDVLGAQACAIHGCLVRSGKYRPGDEDADDQGKAPDYVIDSVADLPSLWQRLSAPCS